VTTPAAPAAAPAPAAGPAPSAGAGAGAGAAPPAGPGTPQAAASGADGPAGPDGGTAQPGDQAAADWGGDAAAAAASAPGQGSRRFEFLRDADGPRIEGDAVGVKNVYLGDAKLPPRPSRLSEQVIEAVSRSWVEPDGWGNVRGDFGKRRVVILRGEVGYGKQGAAVRLLLSHTRQIFLLARSFELATLPDVLEASRGAGFLLEQPDSFAGLDSSVLRGIEAAIEAADARLVLTVSDTVLPDLGLRDYAVDLTSRPHCRDIVASRLAYLLEDEQLADQLLASPAVQDLVDKTLAAGETCALAADLAGELADELRGAGGVTGFNVVNVTARMARRGTDDFSTWFARLPDTRARSFAVALAVLDKCPYEMVAAGGRSLYRRFESTHNLVMTAGQDPAPEPQRPFRMPRRMRLQSLRAHTERTNNSGLFGLSQVEIARFNDENYPERVLRHAWQEFEVQETLLAWLEELAGDPFEEVRICAGLALGLLATWSFEYVTSEVLRPWARSDERVLREAAACAMRRMAARDPRLRQNARLLVAFWYADRSSPSRQATAARVYGLADSLYGPAAATAALTRLLIVDDLRVAAAIGNAIADLLAPAADAIAGTALASSGSPVADVMLALVEALSDRERVTPAGLAFVILAVQLETRVPSGDGEVLWPGLLRLAARMADVRSLLAAAWRIVLNDPVNWHRAEVVMTIWATYAETDPEIREAFLRLARAIMRGHTRCQAVMRRYAAEWVTADNLSPLPVTSAGIQAILAAESEAA
jgi:hypothetical protein